MFKKTLAIILALSLTVALSACGGGGYGGAPASQQSAAPAPAPSTAAPEAAPEAVPEAPAADFSSFDTYKIKVAHFFGDTHPQHLALLEFQKECAEKSGGKIVVELYSNAQLGPEDAYIDSIKQGTVEMGAAGTLMARDIPGVMIAEMPFLFDGWDHAKSTLGGDIGKKIVEPMIDAIGVRTLAWTVNGFRQVSSNKPVKSLADFKGLRLRVPNTPVYIKTFEALGVNPIAMPLTEVFTALEQKVVDGQDNPYATVHASSFFEVQSNIIETRHMFSPILWIMNEKFYQSLPDEFRDIVDEAVKNAADHNWQVSEEMDTSEKEWLKSNGMDIFEPDAALKQELVDAQINAGMYDWFYGQYPGTQELEAEIRAAAK